MRKISPFPIYIFCICSEPLRVQWPIVVQNRELKKFFLLWIAVTLWIKTMIFYSYINCVDKSQSSVFYPLHFRLSRRFCVYLLTFVPSNLILIHRHFARLAFLHHFRYNKNIKSCGKKVAWMPVNITEEFVRYLMEQNASLSGQVAELTATVDSMNPNHYWAEPDHPGTEGAVKQKLQKHVPNRLHQTGLRSRR